MKRWVCPTCGKGANAPERMYRDDVRRYCLPCSAKTGRLALRNCPAIDRERENRKTKRAARTRTAAERSKTAERERRTVGGVDLLAEAKRFARLPALRGLRRFPDIKFRRSGGKSFTSGHCYYGYQARIVVTVGTDPYQAFETLLHEMVHALHGAEGHSALFWKTLRQAAREAWPTATFDFLNARDGWTTDQAIRDGLANSAASTP